MTPATLDQARAAQRKLAGILKRLRQLQGIGITTVKGGFALKVNLSVEIKPGKIPIEVDGVPVIVTIVGEISAL